MPRVANPPGAKGRAAPKQTLASPHKQSPVKLSMNDDRTEKAARLQSRQALHDMQLNQLKAAASPMRKISGYDSGGAGTSSPRTPRSAAALARDRERGKENTDPNGSPGGLLNAVSSSAVTPMKRVPILANFEEWMKMATDNKINAANSWNFALIDYFHDMSLLKEGDGVNFQKASCTLDGCVKIYTSRVDSVATETGKLLSGLADSGSGKKGKGGKEGEDGESGDEEEDEDGQRKKTKKKTQRSHEQTLAPSFASLQLKKLELEFAVDPLFKKASADFDEGGAKGLLLNHLSIDSEGRIVFDSSDDTTDTTSYPNQTQMQQTLVDPTAPAPIDPSDLSMLPDGQSVPQEIDLGSLGSKFFPDLSVLDSQDICPSMKSFALGDPNSDMHLPFLKAPDDWRETNKTDDDHIDIPLDDRSGIFLDSENAAGFDDDDDMGPLNGFDVGPDIGFGEGGEAWAKDAALEPMLRVAQADQSQLGEGGDGIVVGEYDPADPSQDAYAVSLNHRSAENDPTANILSYFDAALKSTKAAAWAGPEHWRIRKIKAAQSASENPPPPRVRKEKEPFVIDFLSPMDAGQAEMLYTTAASNAVISLPKTQWKTKGRNLLPDDRHFNSRSLLGLWLKPKARVGRRKAASGMPNRHGGKSDALASPDDGAHVEMDEAYWARKREEEDRHRLENAGGRTQGDYDANFFADDNGVLPFGDSLPDDDDDDDGPIGFTDAREMLSPPPSAGSDAPLNPLPNPDLDALASQPNVFPEPPPSTLLPGSFGTQLVTQAGRRMRPQYVNYARVAKKVDVRRLKENMWRGMSGRLMAAIDSLDEHNNNDNDNGAAEFRPLTPAPTEDGDRDVDMMDIDSDPAQPPPPQTTRSDGETDKDMEKEAPTLKFTSLIRDLTKVYPEQQMRDISTSYCFICLLHLANEKGLVLESTSGAVGGGGSASGAGGGANGWRLEGAGQGGMSMMPDSVAGTGLMGLMQEISVRRDLSVGEGYVGE